MENTVAFAGVLLASQNVALGRSGPFGQRLNGSQVNDPTAFFGATAGSYYARGNRGTVYSFSVNWLFTTEDACEAFLFDHFRLLPEQGDLVVTASDGTTRILEDAVIDDPQFSEIRGCVCVVTYTFRGGLFVSEDAPDPDEDGTNAMKLDEVALDMGDESKLVAFVTPFGGVPKVVVTLNVPDAGLPFSCVVKKTTISAAGFTVQLGAAVPAADYSFTYIAILP